MSPNRADLVGRDKQLTERKLVIRMKTLRSQRIEFVMHGRQRGAKPASRGAARPVTPCGRRWSLGRRVPALYLLLRRVPRMGRGAIGARRPRAAEEQQVRRGVRPGQRGQPRCPPRGRRPSHRSMATICGVSAS